MSNYLFGADPELFIKNSKTGKFVSAHGIVPGTKANPYPVSHGAVQLDGTAAEFNIDPAATFKDFKRNILAVKAQLLEIVQNHDKDLILVASPTAKFDQKYFDNVVPDSSKELGCQPDFCGMTGLANPRPDPGNRPFRTGGGHVHIGWGSGFDLSDPAHFADCRVMAQCLYNSGMKLDSQWDSDSERRTLYGSKFSFRPKSFGMEYRYLSNAWVDNEKAMEFVFNVAETTVRNMDLYFKDFKHYQVKGVKDLKSRNINFYPHYAL